MKRNLSKSFNRERLAHFALFLVAIMAIIIPVLETCTPDGSIFAQWQSWSLWRARGEIHPVEDAELTFAPLRNHLSPRSHIGYVVYATLQDFITQEESVNFYFACQYALSPSVVRLIHVPYCLTASPATCGLMSTDFILMHDERNDAFSKLVKDLGFVQVAESKGFTLLKRNDR